MSLLLHALTSQCHCTLQDMEQRQIAPELYPYGSRGPVGAHYLAAKHGVRWGDMVDNPELELS